MKIRLSAAFCLLCSLFFFSCATNKDMGVLNDDDKIWTYPVKGIDCVSIDLEKASVDVSLYPGEDIMVVASSSDARYPECYRNDNTIVCKESFFNSSSKLKVKVYVPETFFAEEWKISTSSGKINASQIWAQEAEIENTSGSIVLTKCEVQNITVSSVSGSIKAESLFCPGTGNFSAVSGSINVSGVVGGGLCDTISGSVTLDLIRLFAAKMELSTLSGSIMVKLPENNGFTLEYDTMSGRVSDEFTDTVTSKSGMIKYRNGGVRIQADSLSGSIYVERK